MSSNTLIGWWSTGVWQNLGALDSLSALTISGFAVQPSTIGSVNNLLGTCFSGSGFGGTGMPFDVAPSYTSAELAIVEGLFLVSYYSQLAMTLMGTSQATIGWTALAEGDSRISRANTAYLGKEYREMAKDARAQLYYLANSWVSDSWVFKSCDFLNPSNTFGYPYGNPAGGVTYGGGE